MATKKKSKPSGAKTNNEPEVLCANNADHYGEQPLYPVHLIVVNDSKNARKNYDDEEMESLVESILKVGLLEPIGIEIVDDPSEITEAEAEQLALGDDVELDDYGRIVYGYRRLRAVRIIMERHPGQFDDGVPYMRTTFGAETERTLMNLAENLGRVDLLPAEAAEQFAALKEGGLSVATIASRVGKTRQYVSFLVKIKKEASEELWAAFSDGTLSFDVVRKIMSLQAEEGDAEATAKLQARALKKALKVAEEHDGKDRKAGVSDAVEEAATGSTKPKGREINEKLDAVMEQESTEYLQGVVAALNWVTGRKTRLALKPSTGRVKKPSPAKASKRAKAE